MASLPLAAPAAQAAVSASGYPSPVAALPLAARSSKRYVTLVSPQAASPDSVGSSSPSRLPLARQPLPVYKAATPIQRGTPTVVYRTPVQKFQSAVKTAVVASRLAQLPQDSKGSQSPIIATATLVRPTGRHPSIVSVAAHQPCCFAPRWIQRLVGPAVPRALPDQAAPKAGAARPASKAKAAPLTSPSNIEGKASPATALETLPRLPQRLPKFQGCWTWLRKSNSPEHRQSRRQATNDLLRAFEKGGYVFEDREGLIEVKFQRIGEMIAETEVLSVALGLPELPANPKKEMKLDFVSEGPIAAAVDFTRQGFKVVTTNAASAYHLGGGFTSGGRHALEEAFCTQSTIFPSLKKVENLRNRDGQNSMYIPEDGCVVSPHVEIFRGATTDGYPLQKPTELAAVISIAMYNCNPQMRDSPMDAPHGAAYEQGVKTKFQALFHGAALKKADVLIIPDVGCGVFHNDPKIVGRIAGECLKDFKGRFARVLLAGSRTFYEAAAAALEGLA